MPSVRFESEISLFQVEHRITEVMQSHLVQILT